MQTKEEIKDSAIDKNEKEIIFKEIDGDPSPPLEYSILRKNSEVEVQIENLGGGKFAKKVETKENTIFQNTDTEDIKIEMTDTPLNKFKEGKNTPAETKAENTNNKEEEFKIRVGMLMFLSINASLCYYYRGYQIGVFNPLQENISFDLKWTKDVKTTNLSLISAMLYVGAIFGAGMIGKIAATLGRKPALIIFNVLSIVGIAITLIDNTISMIIGRFVCGVATGAFQVLVPLYVKEYAPKKFTGICSAIYNIALCVGLICAFALGKKSPPSNRTDLVWWRVCYAFPMIILILSMILLLAVFKLDTPKFLLEVKKDRELCLEALKFIYEDPDEIEKILCKMEDEIKESENAESIGYKELFCSGRFNKQLFLGIWMSMAFQFNGSYAFNAYSTLIFLRTLDQEMAKIFTLLTGIMSLVGAIVSIFIWGRIPNKIVLLVGYSLIFAILVIVSLLEHYELYDAQKYLVLLFNFIIGSAFRVYYKVGPELLPDIGVSFIGIVLWVSCVTVVLAFPFMIESVLEFKWSLLVFASFTIVTIILIGILYKETNEKSLKEVEELYKTWF